MLFVFKRSWNTRLLFPRDLHWAISISISCFISACQPNPCLNGGTCKLDADEPQGYRCLCTPQYAGLTCESKEQLQSKIVIEALRYILAKLSIVRGTEIVPYHLILTCTVGQLIVLARLALVLYGPVCCSITNFCNWAQSGSICIGWFFGAMSVRLWFQTSNSIQSR